MSYPVLAFHGTREANIHSICQEGFRVPGDTDFEHATDTGEGGSEEPRGRCYETCVCVYLSGLLVLTIFLSQVKEQYLPSPSLHWVLSGMNEAKLEQNHSARYHEFIKWKNHMPSSRINHTADMQLYERFS